MKLQQRLGRSGISSAVIGGLAVGVWGEPRATRDVDLKVLLQRDEAPRLDLLMSDTEFDAEAVRQAVSVKLAPGAAARVCRAESLIVCKLVSTRPRDHEDAAGIVRRQADVLDDDYVLGWLRRFEPALDDST